MVFTIHNNNQVIFDVEFWLEPSDHEINLWYSRIKITPVTNGIIDLVSRLIWDGAENLDALKSDAREITHLFYWLNGEPNESLPIEAAEKRHYHVFMPHIREVLERFCDKYNLELNID
jgi:5-formyltetrahydrofolate cyclo-ligase